MRQSICIVGTGPSLSDLVDKEALYKSRHVIALNRAINELPEADELFIVDPKIPEKCIIPPDIPLTTDITMKNVIEASVIWKKKAGFVLDHPVLRVRGERMDGITLQGVLPHALCYLFHDGIKEVELIGIDMHNKTHGYQMASLHKMGEFIRLVNVCPSSKLRDELEFREVPWVSNS